LGYKKHTVVNDPLYGFISVPHEIIFEIINHPYFQRLRRITQLGLTYYVYPGARHSRFEHALGAMHLMGLSIKSLRSKGVEISEQEASATQIAILLHDIGHGPFSHTLEHSIVEGVHHEYISDLIMNALNKEFNGKLSLAIEIFNGKHPKKFLHQLVSSQLDMDRMDYLNRDSFYTGVSEGIVNYDRIINKLNVVEHNLVVEVKGIYSVEKFITARRLMYWQVYLHKTTVGIDYMITGILKRAKELYLRGEDLSCTPALHYFLSKKVDSAYFEQHEQALEYFTQLDDFDIIAAIKAWTENKDSILSKLCKQLVNRNLFKVELHNEPIQTEVLEAKKAAIKTSLKLNDEALSYFIGNGSISNNAYNVNSDNIKVLFGNGEVKDAAVSGDLLNISAMAKQVNKYFLCYPKQTNNL